MNWPSPREIAIKINLGPGDLHCAEFHGTLAGQLFHAEFRNKPANSFKSLTLGHRWADPTGRDLVSTQQTLFYSVKVSLKCNYSVARKYSVIMERGKWQDCEGSNEPGS
jgi:hypothetical protein